MNNNRDKTKNHKFNYLHFAGDLTPQPPVLPPETENKEPENCFEEILVDNMLGISMKLSFYSFMFAILKFINLGSL